MLKVKENKPSIVRILISAALLCAIMAIMLWSYATEMQDVFEALEESGKMSNLLWLVKHIAYVVPVIVAAIALNILYSSAKWERAVASKKEKGIAVVITALFTYAVMLPYVISKTPKTPLPQDIIDKIGEVPPSLIEITRGWFFVQIVPFIILALYMFIRCEAEEKELAESTLDE